MPRTIALGPGFLRQTLSDLEISEYPTRTEVSAQLKMGWGADGASLYLEKTINILAWARGRAALLREAS